MNMSATILDGKAIAATMRKKIAEKIRVRQEKKLITPGLAVISVGNDPASQTYIASKCRACNEVGIYSECHELPENIDQTTLEKLIDALNNNAKIHGILLQLPLPAQLDSDELLERINPKKDVDGFHTYNLGRLAQKRPLLRPCTPYGVMTLLHSTNEKIAGKHAVVVGASNIVGRPMALELLLAQCTVTVCHRATQDLNKHIQSADILISATGHYGLIQSDWIKPGAIVIDIGFSKLSNGKITGDIDFETAKLRAGWITHVPGGVGPMTVATLLQNTVMAAEMGDQQ